MCFGTFILLTFIHALGMPLYLEGAKENIKALRIQKKLLD